MKIFTIILISPGSITLGNLEVISPSKGVKVCDILHKKTIRMNDPLSDSEISAVNAVNELRNYQIDNSEKNDLIEFLCCK